MALIDDSIPDSEICKQATQLVTEVSPTSLCNHCIRIFLFGDYKAINGFTSQTKASDSLKSIENVSYGQAPIFSLAVAVLLLSQRLKSTLRTKIVRIHIITKSESLLRTAR